MAVDSNVGFPFVTALTGFPAMHVAQTFGTYLLVWLTGLSLWRFSCLIVYFTAFRHMAADCNSKTMCWNCKEPGHLSTECKNQPICHSCEKMGHLARECPKSCDPRVCSNCFQPGHLAADCINEKACNKCRKPGHLARECLNVPICNTCNLSGHVARQCPNQALPLPFQPQFPSPLMFGGPPIVGGQLYNIYCRNCGCPGHISHQCMFMIMCSVCGDRGHQPFECPSGPMLDINHMIHRRFWQLTETRRVNIYGVLHFGLCSDSITGTEL